MGTIDQAQGCSSGRFRRHTIPVLFTLALAMVVAAQAADISGKWTAEFDTQIGVQKYTYEFKVEGGKLTGKATSANGSSDIQEGKLSGDEVKFGRQVGGGLRPLASRPAAAP